MEQGARGSSARSRSIRSTCGTRTRSTCSTSSRRSGRSRRGRFRIVAPPEEAELLAPYLVPLLEEAYDSLAARYGYRPHGPVRLELYPQSRRLLRAHRGPRRARRARRELRQPARDGCAVGAGARRVQLGLDRVARARARVHARRDRSTACRAGCRKGCRCSRSGARAPGWGAGCRRRSSSRRTGRGRLRPLSQLNDGFVRPRFSGEVHAQLLPGVARLRDDREAQFGPQALVGHAHRVPGRARHARRVRARAQAHAGAARRAVRRAGCARGSPSPLRAIAASDSGKALRRRVRHGDAERRGDTWRGSRPTRRASRSSARRRCSPTTRARARPAQYLAALAARCAATIGEALAQVTRVTTRSETAWEANMMEAELREKLGDYRRRARAAGAAALDLAVRRRRCTCGSPTLATPRGRSRARRCASGARSSRCNPPDPLDARYQLARALAASGDSPAARRELLRCWSRRRRSRRRRRCCSSCAAAQQRSTP